MRTDHAKTHVLTSYPVEQSTSNPPLFVSLPSNRAAPFYGSLPAVARGSREVSQQSLGSTGATTMIRRIGALSILRVERQMPSGMQLE